MSLSSSQASIRWPGSWPESSDATAWCSALLEEKGVALVPGAAFGDDRWVRMSYASSDDTLEEALRRISAFVEGHAGS